MAVPITVKKEVADYLESSTWYVALYNHADALALTAYSTTNEITGTGYTAGGAALGTLTTGNDGTSSWSYVDAADTAWASATFSARYYVVYDNTGSKLVRATGDFGTTYSVTGGTFTIQWAAPASGGIVKVS